MASIFVPSLPISKSLDPNSEVYFRSHQLVLSVYIFWIANRCYLGLHQSKTLSAVAYLFSVDAAGFTCKLFAHYVMKPTLDIGTSYNRRDFDIMYLGFLVDTTSIPSRGWLIEMRKQNGQSQGDNSDFHFTGE
jgi:hypothetical protein